MQVCSSTTHPAPTRLLHTITCGYLNEAPPAALGRHARKNYVVDILRSDAAFRARCLAHNVRVGSMCAMLRLAGEGKAAKKVPSRLRLLPSVDSVIVFVVHVKGKVGL